MNQKDSNGHILGISIQPNRSIYSATAEVSLEAGSETQNKANQIKKFWYSSLN